MSRISSRAIIHHDGKFLLTRLRQFPTFWCLPGGGLENGESIIDCLKRELVEELGIEPDVGQLLYVHQIRENSQHSGPGFFFDIKNSIDYLTINLAETQLGQEEIEEVGFKDITTVNLLPSFLKSELPAMYKNGAKIFHSAQIRVTESES